MHFSRLVRRTAYANIFHTSLIVRMFYCAIVTSKVVNGPESAVRLRQRQVFINSYEFYMKGFY